MLVYQRVICDTMGLRQAREQSRGSSKRNVDEAACAMATSCLRRCLDRHGEISPRMKGNC